MQNSVVDVLLSIASDLLVSGKVFIAIGDATDVFHSSMLEVWAKNLIQFVKWVGALEHLFVVLDSSSSHTEPVFSCYFSVFRHRFTAKEAEGHRKVGIFSLRGKDIVRTGHKAVQVSR